MDFDVLYLGSGQATWNGAVPLAKTGVKIAVVEESQYGGVCSNKGCNAKIILDKPIELVEKIKALQGRGIDGVPSLNWKDLMAHKHELIVPQDEHGQSRLTNAGITTISGHAEFVDAHTVKVNGKNYTADKIVIATGMRPHRLDIPGKELFHDSTDFLSLPDMPKHMTILGGGFVAIEFATIANAVGAQVDVITRSNRLLRQFPAQYVAEVQAELKDRGVRFIPDMEIKSAEKQADDSLKLVGPHEFTLETDYVLDATGRIPNHDQLNLEAAGVKANARGIIVNDNLQTNVANIYAAGDALDKTTPKLTPTAAFESRYLAAKFMGKNKGPIKYPVISEIVFTSPRIAQVGVKLDEALADNERYEVEQVSYDGDWFRQVENENGAKLALIFDKQAGKRLVGAAELSHEADNTINAILPYIQMKMTREQLNDLVYLFPSIEYTLQRRLPLV
ncbi:dihydrolipoyl dehydrogenase family protein [Eupransor demetentiae]|uniref:Dihydrolipoamide dehydrogenase (E3) component of pyruvate/2-oxoglutarate dehydrogenase complex or glutathione oxidoreductase (Lpd) n=1 Tax=Eupransor demetentiae TaxID=3109584 RepID=A0ABM9N3B0_9LACO|nr:Dihydrolipoamide dehydrogenase (E3) component of pyruvate/2-oxoglutarate dehydrogenase complex or glutathione oxidoreductase (Lpd) [Lactobacillaceae bacterium LMG 33000]